MSHAGAAMQPILVPFFLVNLGKSGFSLNSHAGSDYTLVLKYSQEGSNIAEPQLTTEDTNKIL